MYEILFFLLAMVMSALYGLYVPDLITAVTASVCTTLLLLICGKALDKVSG